MNQHTASVTADRLVADESFRAMCEAIDPATGVVYRYSDLTRQLVARGERVSEATVARAGKRVRAGETVAENATVAPPPTVGETVESDRASRRAKIDAGEYRKRYEHAIERLDEAEHRLSVALALEDAPDILRIPKNPALDRNEGAAMWLWSDWHIEERVDRARVNGHNEYNPDIAEARVKKLVANSLAMTKIARQDIHIDTCVLWLGGDFINGYIHDELEETNFMSPTEATLFAYQLLVSAIQHVVDNGRFKRIVVPCNFGNHGRTTHKKRISSGYKNSYEWMMYHMLKRHFAACDVLEFIIPESSYCYVEVFGRTIRTFHGDEVGYGGGIGGVAIPLIKKIHRLNTQRLAHMNVLGHFHQLCYPTSDTSMNGSLVGFSPYAEWLGCKPEPPMQGFRLIDAKRGFTISTPIFCE